MKKANFPGCCVGGIYYDLGHAHSITPAKDLTEFANRIINCGLNHVMVMATNNSQTKERKWLEELGFITIKSTDGSRQKSYMYVHVGFNNGEAGTKLNIIRTQALKKQEEERRKRAELRRKQMEEQKEKQEAQRKKNLELLKQNNPGIFIGRASTKELREACGNIIYNSYDLSYDLSRYIRKTYDVVIHPDDILNRQFSSIVLRINNILRREGRYV